ncbi:MAG: adenosylcobinamide-GDP ribazoletransferase [Methylotenera sp.]|nr:adenosylcobinamide-GDP ribazoletransferase [Methylotenera sp.]
MNLSKEWRYFLLALGFFTRVPTPSYVDFKEEELNHASQYFPLVGVLVGLVGALAFIASVQLLPSHLAVLLSMATTVYLTGAFHEDGLADSADGLGGGWDSERILTIMQDSRLGTYGAVVLFFALMLKYQLLNALPMPMIAMSLITAHALSRLWALYMMASLNYVKAQGKAKPLATQVQPKALALATLFGTMPFVWMLYDAGGVQYVLTLALYCLLPMGMVFLWWRNKIKCWIGGYTGDCLGATQQLTEIAFYLGLVAYCGVF